MMTTEIVFTGKDLSDLRKKISPKLFGDASRKLLTNAAKAWVGLLKKYAPKFRGDLSGSFQFNVDSSEQPKYANVGSNARHAKPMNYGTGTLSIAPDSSRRPHFPPPGALQSWGLAHGFYDGPGSSIWSTAGGKVASAIGRRGGLAPREFMRKSADELKRLIPRIVSNASKEIEREWTK